jgi:hypothetical protein
MIAAHAPFISSPSTADRRTVNLAWVRAAALAEAALDWVRQTLCGLHGHAMMLQFESTRLSLQCMSCGRTTPGWSVGDNRES